MTLKNAIGCVVGKGSQIVSTQLVCFVVFCCFSYTNAAVSQDGFDQQFRLAVIPFLKTYCHECHSGDVVEADINFTQFTSVTDVRSEIKTWVKVRNVLQNSEMPPKDSEQPADKMHAVVRGWVTGFLKNEAKVRAGDPGSVVLRRLNNSEYTYTIRDLTGVETLDPTREFPVDGAAGEGFINTGDALSMSANLVRKYLDAASEIAKHAVFTPSGMRFSTKTTRRDVVDEMMDEIRGFYQQHSHSSKSAEIEEQSLLHVGSYLHAIVNYRQLIQKGEMTIGAVASRCDLSSKYLQTLWALCEQPQQHTFLLRQFAERINTATPETIGLVIADVESWQKSLWKLNIVGHIGRSGAPAAWQESVNPVVRSVNLMQEIDTEQKEDVVVWLQTRVAGGDSVNDYVVWESARLEKEGEEPIMLANVEAVYQRYVSIREESLKHAAEYLEVVAAAEQLDSEPDLKKLSSEHDLDEVALRVWMSLMGVEIVTPFKITGHMLKQTKSAAGYKFINGWGLPATPGLTANSSDTAVRIPGLAHPHGITVHPSPTQFVATAWQSPIAGAVSVESLVADAHDNCGNGVEYFLRHLSGQQVNELWHGELDRGGKIVFAPKRIHVKKGDVVAVFIGPRAGEYSCDLTRVDLTVREVDGKQREWDLAKDCSGDILAGNPHSDRLGNQAVWHFYIGKMETLRTVNKKQRLIPENSLLWRWLNEPDPSSKQKIALAVQELALGLPPADSKSPDGRLFKLLQNIVSNVDLASLQKESDADPRFGKHPGGAQISQMDLVAQRQDAVYVTIPALLGAGRTLRVTATNDSAEGEMAAAQFSVDIRSSGKPPQPMRNEQSFSGDEPIVVSEKGLSTVVTALDDFRKVFPRTLAYVRIVPVDEVVTMVLWYREDEGLQRLMLNEAQQSQLDKLWDEFMFVAQEPLRYEVAFEQISEFATQDRPDIVKQLDPLKQHVVDYAKAFRIRLRETEPLHLQALVDFADRAWRQDITEAEIHELRELYVAFRETGTDHEPACRLLLTRILSSPNFLFKMENQQSGVDATAVSKQELAVRLSYFLWSSLPDAVLRTAARKGVLTESDAVLAQTHRLLEDPRIRRMAIEFACQWLHVRGFDKNDTKNEKLFPEFIDLRSDMYEETVLFFEDLIQTNGSVLDIIAADYTFLNERLAKHYGISGVVGTEWRKVTGLHQYGRGGILAMASTLAANSGASRTSPILRGNWVYETLLGKQLPNPPVGVPVLPEIVPEDLTARQLIELHSSAVGCAKCHALIDPYGFALEQYDVLGRIRERAVDTKTRLPDQTEIEGLSGLRKYLTTETQNQFLHQFCRKLLGYALGREVQLSDQLLVDKMVLNLQKNDFRIRSAIDDIVLSKQFRFIRGRDLVPH
ncbi:MAG: DUF1592 domain-containing protein [Planctomycetaceae bacterium]|nr:DUF1592 domain-containing protein [Planctomycetaceae bacterium]MBT4845409.1 DUF1592 domain-containing protein [Planctomycetaceae bacterium]MBT5125057.1 DUF1592 domain-containing protein [Planctomycetaceae bacterium]MBT5599889.1 DUF1592 domain-containing protein [Planctomycetaceae bacterium]